MSARPIVWTIAGTDPSGGAGIQADLKVFHALGVYGGSAITAVIAQNTLGVRAIEPVSPAMFTAQLEALREDLIPRAVKIGMLVTAHAVRETARILADLDAFVICDPVLASSSGASFLDADGRRALIEVLLPRVDLLTPNAVEAGILAGHEVRGPDDVAAVAQRLLALGARAVLLKGGHLPGALARDFLARADDRRWISSPRWDVRHTHGTGCTLSAAIAAFTAHGKPLDAAVLLGKAYVNQGLRLGGGIGHGRGPLAHLGWPSDERDLPSVEPAPGPAYPPPGARPPMNDQPIRWYPLTFRPVYKDYIWGGDRIVHKFHRDMPPGIYAESWEISTRPEGMSVVADGPLAGATLQSLVEAHGAALLGSRVGAGPFPLLVKLIDSRERLSVQVHPNDATAAQHGGEAKTEMWHVLEAAPHAQVYAGFKPGTGRHDLEDAIRNSRFEDVLATVQVASGDTIFVPGGRVHALDAGLLILEVQQNSNTTYRLYDWGRVGHDGKPRETHVEQALRVIDWNDAGSPKTVPAPLPCDAPNAADRLVKSPYFRIERRILRAPAVEPDDAGGFRILFVAEGSLRMEWPDGASLAVAGTSILVPAALRGMRLVPESGTVTLIRASIP